MVSHPEVMASSYPNPVIFIPGIMGSALRDQYPVSPETVWSPFKLFIKAYERITPHPSDLRYELQEPARVTADQVFEIIYADFIEELRHNLSLKADEPVPVFPFAYDWRQPLENTEAQLADFVDEVIDRTRLLRHYHDAGYGGSRFPAQVNLAGHSMGGIIIAGYLQKNGQKKVNRVATLGTPFRGSLEAIAKTTVGVAALGSSPGGSREREAARVTPSLYYLLPSFKGAVSAEPGLANDLFLPQAWQPGIAGTLREFIRMYGIDPADPDRQAVQLLTTMLDGAWRYRTRTEKLQLQAAKDWLCIVGVDATTRVRMRISKDDTGKPRFDLTDADVRNDWKDANPAARVYTGDNTVPYLGARAKFIPSEQVICVTPGDFSFWEFKDRALEAAGFHSSLPNLNLAQRLVVSHFRGQKYGDVWGRPAPDLPAGVAWDPPIAGLPRR
jgi:pimeloyl-ACP methyl ester carboxylesterase